MYIWICNEIVNKLTFFFCYFCYFSCAFASWRAYSRSHNAHSWNATKHNELQMLAALLLLLFDEKWKKSRTNNSCRLTEFLLIPPLRGRLAYICIVKIIVLWDIETIYNFPIWIDRISLDTTKKERAVHWIRPY